MARKNEKRHRGGAFDCYYEENYSISERRFLRLRLRARASLVRRFSPGFR